MCTYYGTLCQEKGGRFSSLHYGGDLISGLLSVRGRWSERTTAGFVVSQRLPLERGRCYFSRERFGKDLGVVLQISSFADMASVYRVRSKAQARPAIAWSGSGLI